MALLRQHPLNGYQIAKVSKVPRANIYAVLQKLEERGAVLRVQSADDVRYSPVPPAELTRRIGSRFEEDVAATRTALEDLGSVTGQDYVWNAEGLEAVLAHAGALVVGAKRDVLLAVGPEESAALETKVRQACARGVSVTTLCLAGCTNECGHCAGRVYRYGMAPGGEHRSLIAVVDEEEMLAAEIAPSLEARSVRTRQHLVVELAASFIRRSIAIAALLNDLGNQLDQIIGPGTKAILAGLGPGGTPGGWLEHMHRIMKTPKSAQS